MASVSETCWFLLFVGIVGIVMVVAWGTGFARGREQVRSWARTNNLELVQLNYQLWQRAFFWKLAHHQVWHVTVRCVDGSVRQGWVRTSWYTGRIKVKWKRDDEHSNGQEHDDGS